MHCRYVRQGWTELSNPRGTPRRRGYEEKSSTVREGNSMRSGTEVLALKETSQNQSHQRSVDAIEGALKL